MLFSEAPVRIKVKTIVNISKRIFEGRARHVIIIYMSGTSSKDKLRVWKSHWRRQVCHQMPAETNIIGDRWGFKVEHRFSHPPPRFGLALFNSARFLERACNSAAAEPSSLLGAEGLAL